MRLDHRFTVPARIDEAWTVLLDLPGIAPCMPGATLTDVDGTTFSGTVKVKLGPISLLYRGTGRFAETDEAARRIVIEASGKESRGSGTAAATVTATLTPADGDQTQVDVATDLKITGRPAQFGRGMLDDVGAKLLGQFAECLATRLGGSAAAAATGGTAAGAASAETVAPAPAEAAESIDLLEITGVQAAIRRYGPFAAAAATFVVVLWVILRRNRRR